MRGALAMVYHNCPTNASISWRTLANRYWPMITLLTVAALFTLSLTNVHWSSLQISAFSQKSRFHADTTAAAVTTAAATTTATTATAAVTTATVAATTTAAALLKRHLPHCILIGVMKSGTRALQTFLDLHPDVVTTQTEVHYFDMHYDKGREWYRRCMPPSSPTQITVERTPRYYRVADVPERIYQMNSTIKLVLIVREPVARSVSNYLQYAANNKNLPSFENMILLDNGEINPQSKFIINSDYSSNIDKWYKYFSRNQLKIVDGSLLVTNPSSVMQEMQEYLGLRQYIDDSFFHYNATKGFYCFYNPSYTCLGQDKGRKHPKISPELQHKLYAFFKPKNEQFFTKIGKRFNWKLEM